MQLVAQKPDGVVFQVILVIGLAMGKTMVWDTADPIRYPYFRHTKKVGKWMKMVNSQKSSAKTSCGKKKRACETVDSI
jgi:hypothetical protein